LNGLKIRKIIKMPSTATDLLKQWGLACFLCMLAAVFTLQAQPLLTGYLSESLTESNVFPEELLATKSMVLIQTALPEGQSQKRADWKQLAAEAHPYLKESGIDAVAYANLEDIFSGYDAIRYFSNRIGSRDIQHLVIIEQYRNVSRRIAYRIVLTTFNGEPSLISNGQAAYIIHGQDLEVLLGELNRRLALSELEMLNFLIIDVPEYLSSGADLVRGKSFPNYNPDLKLDKLAVPNRTGSAILIASAGSDNDSTLQKPVKSIMANYPFDYDFVSYSFEEQEILNRGYQWLLMELYSTPGEIKQFLQMKPDPDSTTINGIVIKQENIELVTWDVQTPVHKYYIKHIYTGDIYVGTAWDAHTSRDQALETFIKNLRKELVENR